MGLNENKTKRNKPCEHCRNHRRRCIVLNGTCERCQKMKLTCVFKYTEKPTTPRVVLSTTKKNQVLMQAQQMEMAIVAMEEQLKRFRTTIQREKQLNITATQCDCVDPSKCHHLQQTSSKKNDSYWQLSIHRGKYGLVFETGVQTVSDMLSMMNHSTSYFSISKHSFGDTFPIQSTLKVTHRLLQIEQLFRKMFCKNTSDNEKTAVAIDHTNWVRMMAKRHLIDTYMSCANNTTPVFVQSYYVPYFQKNPHSMLASAMAAFASYSQCFHIHLESSQYSRQELAESFRKEACALLDETLFEDSSIETAATLMLVGQCLLIMLCNEKARIQINMAWRMVVELKQVHCPHLNHPDIRKRERAETWRRLFYAVRYLEQTMMMIYDNASDISSLDIYKDVGYPTPLPTEQDPKSISSVTTFHYVILLRSFHMSSQMGLAVYRLFGGFSDSIPTEYVHEFEKTLFSCWLSLPAGYHLSDQPMSYLQLDRVQQCQDPNILYLNLAYYIHWILFETKIMQAPATANLNGASLSCLDDRRALIIVSMCCDAVAKIFQVLYCHLPCMVELHWLLVAGDAMGLLRGAADLSIQMKAEHNLKVTLKILGNRMQAVQKNTTMNCVMEGTPSPYPNDLDTSSLCLEYTPTTASGTPPPSDDTSASSCPNSPRSHASRASVSTGSTCSSDDLYDLSDSLGPKRRPSPYFGEVSRTLESHFSYYGHPSSNEKRGVE